MTEPIPASVVEQLATHRQNGSRCEADGQPWPCSTRTSAPGHYRPGGGIPNWREAMEVVARHTERDGHCTACGEEWMCWTGREARAELEVYARSQPPWS